MPPPRAAVTGTGAGVRLMFPAAQLLPLLLYRIIYIYSWMVSAFLSPCRKSDHTHTLEEEEEDVERDSEDDDDVEGDSEEMNIAGGRKGGRCSRRKRRR